MGLFAHVKKWLIIHLLIFYVFVVSGLIVNFLMLCTSVFWLINKDFYRRLNSYLAYSHWCQVTALASWWSNSDCILYCNPEDREMIGKEHSIYMLNHNYEIDFVMLWIMAERFQMLGGTKIYGKEVLKFAPIIGFAWYFTESIFLKRDWAKDKQILRKCIEEITTYPRDVNVSLLLFPEGTRFTPEKHQASLEVCKDKGYHELKNLLLPRSKGFYISALGMKGKNFSIMDGTIAFPLDEPEPNLWRLIQGESIIGHLKIKRIPVNDIPTDTEEETAEWLRQCFVEKDKTIDYFKENGRFEGRTYRVPRRLNDLIMWIIWLTIITIPSFYYALNIFLSGTVIQKVLFIGIIGLGLFLVQKIIGLTEISKGSSYGKETKNNKKKTQ